MNRISELSYNLRPSEINEIDQRKLIKNRLSLSSSDERRRFLALAQFAYAVFTCYRLNRNSVQPSGEKRSGQTRPEIPCLI